MSDIVVFSYATWVARYPEFANISAAAAQAYFDEATIYHRNDATGPVTLNTVQLTLLNMLTAHIAWLNAPRDAAGNPSSSGTQQGSPLVGRINSATEGSVTVSAEMSSVPAGPNQAWFDQTKYGAAYWQATAQYRQATFRTPPPRVFNSQFPFGVPWLR